MFISLSTARLRFVQTPTPSGQHWNRFFQTIFSFQKNFLLTKKKKREFLIFFKTQIFFAICFLFDKKKKQKMKNTIRERRYPRAIFSLFFVFQNMVARWRFYLFLETPNLL